MSLRLIIARSKAPINHLIATTFPVEQKLWICSSLHHFWSTNWRITCCSWAKAHECACCSRIVCTRCSRSHTATSVDSGAPVKRPAESLKGRHCWVSLVVAVVVAGLQLNLLGREIGKSQQEESNKCQTECETETLSSEKLRGSEEKKVAWERGMVSLTFNWRCHNSQFRFKLATNSATSCYLQMFTTPAIDLRNKSARQEAASRLKPRLTTGSSRRLCAAGSGLSNVRFRVWMSEEDGAAAGGVVMIMRHLRLTSCSRLMGAKEQIQLQLHLWHYRREPIWANTHFKSQHILEPQ